MSATDELELLLRAAQHLDGASIATTIPLRGTYNKRRLSPNLLGSACSNNKKFKSDCFGSGLPSAEVVTLFQNKHAAVDLTFGGQSNKVQDGKSSTTAIVLDGSDDSEDPLLSNYFPLPLECEDEVDALQKEATNENWFYPAAFMFIEQAAAKVMKLSPQDLPDFVRLVRMDKLIEMTERLLEKQAEFLAKGKPCLVDIGYHYTRAENLPQIKSNGLLSKSQREERGIQSKYNGSIWGDGIYTGPNPGDHFGRYGTTGLVVLRLKGTESTSRHSSDHDTTVNSLDPVAQNIAVLKNSAQCVPIFQYDASMIKRRDPNCCTHHVLKSLHDALQRTVDSTINKKCPDFVPSPQNLLTSSLIDSAFGAPPAQLGSVSYDVSARLEKEMLSRGLFPGVVPVECGLECPVCCEPLGRDSRKVAQVGECGHVMHVSCLFQSNSGPGLHCSSCRQALNTPPCLGSMPSGRMDVSRDALLTCAGHSWGTLIITYVFPGGVQSEFHPNPGTPYESTTRTAYLPDTSEGRILLSRLQESFRLGLSFRIGQSLSTRKSNVITWGSIPHKSTIRGRGRRCTFGYPDEGYFGKCHAALDALHVRQASSDALLRGDEAFKSGETQLRPMPARFTR